MAIKGIPVINIAADVLNAIIAAAIVASIGEAMLSLMKKIEKGDIKIEEVEKIEKTISEHFNASSMKVVNSIIDGIRKCGDNVKLSDILGIIKNVISR